MLSAAAETHGSTEFLESSPPSPFAARAKGVAGVLRWGRGVDAGFSPGGDCGSGVDGGGGGGSHTGYSQAVVGREAGNRGGGGGRNKRSAAMMNGGIQGAGTGTGTIFGGSGGGSGGGHQRVRRLAPLFPRGTST